MEKMYTNVVNAVFVRIIKIFLIKSFDSYIIYYSIVPPPCYHQNQNMKKEVKIFIIICTSIIAFAGDS